MGSNCAIFMFFFLISMSHLLKERIDSLRGPVLSVKKVLPV